MTELGRLTQEYIDKCNEVLFNKDSIEAEQLQEIIISTFGDYISGISYGLDNFKFYKNGNIDFISDIEKLKAKLEIYLATECKPTNRIEDSKNITISNFNENVNNNTNTIDAKIEIKNLFQEVKKAIEENESLSQSEIEEILKKIEEIKVIYETDESKNKKWLKLKPVMGWVGTKGVSVATAILGLITALLKFNPQ